MILPPINEGVDTTSWTVVTLDASQDCEDYAVQARGVVDVMLSADDAGTTFWTLKANSSISLNEAFGQGTYLFYAKSLLEDTTIEVLPLRRYRNR